MHSDRCLANVSPILDQCPISISPENVRKPKNQTVYTQKEKQINKKAEGKHVSRIVLS